MFNFFKAKFKQEYIDEESFKSIVEFLDYFSYSHKRIESKIRNKDRGFMKEFEQELSKLFHKYDMPLCYNFFVNEDRFTFVFYYGRNDYLLTVFTTLVDKKREYHLENWQFIAKK